MSFNIDGEAGRPVFVARQLMDSRQPCLSITFAVALNVAVKVVFRLGFIAKHFDGQQQSFTLVVADFPAPPYQLFAA